MKNDIPVSLVAAKLGVSRQTVYNWFCGTHTPNTTVARKLTAFYDSITNSK
jgi:DNA-binding XRE family transcriptional regulator